MSQLLDQNKTISIFDTFYNFTTVVNSSEFDIVNGYFTSINSNKRISANFTAMLFRISNETKVPALDILSNIKGKTALEMSKLLAYYLNSLKSKTALYGIGNVPQSNQSVARNAVA